MKYADSEYDRMRRVELLLAAQGAVLRRHRERAGRSLADVAAVAQCSPAHLSEVERGRKDVSAQRLVAIAAALEVPLHLLYGEIAEQLMPAALAETAAVQRDPRAQLELAAASLSSDALRAVADFGTYLAASAAPAQRRIGFVVTPRERR
jgi:transcriptional regulator with XRE-family HTH domain